MFTYRAHETQIHKRINTAINYPAMGRDRKAILLLEHDPFEKMWKVVAWDIAEERNDFTTKNVVQTLENSEN